VPERCIVTERPERRARTRQRRRKSIVVSTRVLLRDWTHGRLRTALTVRDSDQNTAWPVASPITNNSSVRCMGYCQSTQYSMARSIATVRVTWHDEICCYCKGQGHRSAPVYRTLAVHVRYVAYQLHFTAVLSDSARSPVFVRNNFFRCVLCIIRLRNSNDAMWYIILWHGMSEGMKSATAKQDPEMKSQ